MQRPLPGGQRRPGAADRPTWTSRRADRRDRRNRPGAALRPRFLAKDLIPDETTLGLRRQVMRRPQIMRQRVRLMTMAGIDMVVAAGLRAAIGPVERFAGPDHQVAHRGLNPSVHQAGAGKPGTGASPSRGAATRAPCRAGQPGRRCADPLPCAPSSSASSAAEDRTSRRWRSCASWRSSSGTCSPGARIPPPIGLLTDLPSTSEPRACMPRLGGPGAACQEAAKTWNCARANRCHAASGARPTPAT